VIFASIFYDVDVSKSFQLCQTARTVAQELGDLTLANVELVSKSGFISAVVSRLHRHDILSEYGVHMIQRLLESGLPVKDIVWSHILPTAGALVANQAQLFSQCIDYYLSDEAAEHLAEIQRLSREDTPEADELLVR
jgi:linoleate 8R-lipoxygenase/9,12-octadecadienoate 8-hydroperoxide 8R-isomerase